MSAPPGPRRPSDHSLFEDALADAMRAATDDVRPAAVDAARLRREDRTWRVTLPVAVSTAAAMVVAVAVAVVGESPLWTPTQPVSDRAGIAAAATPATSPSEAEPDPAAATLPSAASTAETVAATMPDDPPSPPDPQPEPDAAVAAAAPEPEAGAGGAVPDCRAVPDGSAEVRELVLAEARRQIVEGLAALDLPAELTQALANPSDEVLLDELRMAKATASVEERDVVSCAGQLRYAAEEPPTLEQTVEREVAEELSNALEEARDWDEDDDD